MNLYSYIVLPITIIFTSYISYRTNISTLLLSPTSIFNFKISNNYFVNYLFNNKTIIINTLMLTVVCSVFFYFAPDVKILYPLPFALLASNSSISTMLSSQLDTLKKINSIPKSRIYLDYFNFLLIVYLFSNSILFLVYIASGATDYIVMFILVVLLSVLETVFTTNLEKKYPITNWKTINEVWKNPRKYILPVVVFFLLSIYFMVF